MKRSFLIVAAFAAVGVLLGVAAVDVLTDYFRRVHESPWPGDLGRLEDAPSHFPSRSEPTAEALELVRLAQPLGIDFRLRAREQKPLPARAAFDAIRKPLSDYVSAQLTRETDGIDVPPASVVAYLDAHRADVDAVRTHILRSQSIEWPVRLTDFASSPIPNLVGYMELSKILTADALASRSRAWDDLHAAWRLGAGLRSRPDEISQIIALAMSRTINAAALRIPRAAPPWLGEVGAFDHRRAILRAFQVQAWSWTEIDNPVMHLCGINAADHVRNEADAMARSSDCAVNGKTRDNAAEASLPRWNVLARIASPGRWSTWSRVARFTAEREATARVLQLRRGEAASPSSRCSDGAWTVTARSIAFSRDIDARPGTKYPLRFALSDARE